MTTRAGAGALEGTTQIEPSDTIQNPVQVRPYTVNGAALAGSVYQAP